MLTKVSQMIVVIINSDSFTIIAPINVMTFHTTHNIQDVHGRHVISP